jgi:secreted PhoX family phosphatase
MGLTRRELLQRGAGGALALTFAGGLQPLFTARPAIAGTGRTGYGPLLDDPAGLLDLPDGFRYRVLSRAGDSLAGGGGTVPGSHDGAASFPNGRGTLIVVNHEQGGSASYPVVADPRLTYDPGAFGGTTTLVLDKNGHVTREYVSLAGTISNCAGGAMPWGTWLTCEETEQKRNATSRRITASSSRSAPTTRMPTSTPYL